MSTTKFRRPADTCPSAHGDDCPMETGIRRVPLASYVGSAIEDYDFFSYGTAAALSFPPCSFQT